MTDTEFPKILSRSYTKEKLVSGTKCEVCKRRATHSVTVQSSWHHGDDFDANVCSTHSLDAIAIIKAKDKDMHEFVAPATDQTTLTQSQLAERWNINPRTLENWRQQGKGPAYFKLHSGSRAPVRYRLEDILEFEKNKVSPV